MMCIKKDGILSLFASRRLHGGLSSGASNGGVMMDSESACWTVLKTLNPWAYVHEWKKWERLFLMAKRLEEEEHEPVQRN